MMSLVRPELPTASVGSSQATTAAVDNSALFAICPKSTYKSGNAVQTSGATSLRMGDVLLVRTNGNPEYVGRSVVIDRLHEKSVYASYLIRIRCDESTLRPAFLAEFLNAPTTRQRLRGEVKSSAGNYNINIAGIRKQPICAPNVFDQDALLLQLKDLDDVSEALEARVAASKEIKKHLFAEMWGA